MKILGPTNRVPTEIFNLQPGTVFKYDGSYCVRFDTSCFDGKCEVFDLVQSIKRIIPAYSKVSYYPEAELHLGVEQ